MDLLKKQQIFTQDVAKLLKFAEESGFFITFGEAQRPIEMQELYFKEGRTRTMKSKHIERLAIDLFVFRRDENTGAMKWLQSREDVKQLGEFWESIRPENNWGGFWNFIDIFHFERGD